MATIQPEQPSLTRLHDLFNEIKSTLPKREEHDIDFPSTMMNTLQNDINTVIRSCEALLGNSKNAAGIFLHNLYTENPDPSEVKRVIDMFPSALIYQNEKGEIPIQKNARKVGGIKYVPLLAQEASKHEVSLERGGLLLTVAASTHSPQHNIIQWVASSINKKDPIPYHDDCIQVLEVLKKANLIRNKDFMQFNLIKKASAKPLLRRLEYLLKAHPASLASRQSSGDFPIHLSNYLTSSDSIEIFQCILKAGMEYYPDKFGFLFKRNSEGKRAIDQAIAEYGKNETLNIVQKIVPPSDNHPILHYVFRHTPSLGDEFVYRYPEAVTLKDKYDRHLLHVAVKRGLKMSFPLLTMIHCNKQCLEEKDPVTNLYPFMLAATSGFKKDLTTIYKLLSYRPEVLTKCFDDDDDNCDKDDDCSRIRHSSETLFSRPTKRWKV